MTARIVRRVLAGDADVNDFWPDAILARHSSGRSSEGTPVVTHGPQLGRELSRRRFYTPYDDYRVGLRSVAGRFPLSAVKPSV